MEYNPDDDLSPPFNEGDYEDDELEFVEDLMNKFLYDRIPFTNLYLLMNLILNDENSALYCSTKLTIHRVNRKENPHKYN